MTFDRICAQLHKAFVNNPMGLTQTEDTVVNYFLENYSGTSRKYFKNGIENGKPTYKLHITSPIDYTTRAYSDKHLCIYEAAMYCAHNHFPFYQAITGSNEEEFKKMQAPEKVDAEKCRLMAGLIPNPSMEDKTRVYVCAHWEYSDYGKHHWCHCQNSGRTECPCHLIYAMQFCPHFKKGELRGSWVIGEDERSEANRVKSEIFNT